MVISVVIPCLNEEKTIEKCIEKCFKSFEILNVSGEVIICDNQSVDNTVSIAQKCGAKVISVTQKGYGSALRAGFEQASGDYIVMGDGDNTYDFLEIPKFYNAILESNADMVIGSRFKGYIQKKAMPPLHRYFGTPILTMILNLLFKTKISDSQCGLRIMKKNCVSNIKFISSGMEFASELIILFKINKYKILEVPTNLYEDTKGRIPHLKPFRDGFKHLFLMLNYYFKNLILL